MSVTKETSPTTLFSRLGVLALIVGILYVAQEVLIPIALAVLLSFLLGPLVTRLGRWGLSRVPAVIVVVVLVLCGVGALAYVVSMQFQGVAGQLPRYQRNIQEKVRIVSRQAGEQIKKGAGVLESITTEEAKPSLATPGQPARPIPVEVHQPTRGPLEVGGAFLNSVLGPLGTAGIVIVFVIFMLIEREDLRDRLIRLIGAGDLHTTTTALDDAGQRVSRYLLMQTVVNTMYGVPIAIGLHFIGVPGAMLWGLLATVLRFIPYIGPWIAAAGPLVLALAVSPGWTVLIYTVALFTVLELISNNVVEPWLYGSSTGISNVALIVAAIFWTWLWGPAGLLLSTPLTVCLVVMGTYVPQMEWLSVLLSDNPALDPSARFYQRMLAMDSDEASRIAEEFLKTAPLVELFDQLFVPAVVMAERDRQRELLDDDRRNFIRENTRELVDDLADAFDCSLREASPSALTLCLPAADDGDQLTAHMLAKLIQQRGLPARAVAVSNSASYIDEIHAHPPARICISALPPFAVRQVRRVVRTIQTNFPDIEIMVGFWTSSQAQDLASRLNLRSDQVVNTLAAAVERIASSEPQLSGNPEAPPEIPCELQRLEELHNFSILDTEPEEIFDSLTRELASLFNAPVALLSFVDRDRQFWKSQFGLPEDLAMARQAPRETSICGHAIASPGGVLVVEDTTTDRRFARNQFLQERSIRFYAGAPLRTSSGNAIGTICIIDFKPRTISPPEIKLLELVARGVMVELESRGVAPSADAAITSDEEHLVDAKAAREFQDALLPPEETTGKSWAVRYVYSADSCLAGDFVDVHARPDGTVLTIMADTRAHGAAAALVAAILKMSLTKHADTVGTPEEMLALLEKDLALANGAKPPLHATLAIYDEAAHSVRIASSNQPQPLLIGKDKCREVETGDSGTSVEVQLRDADRLLFFSNGAADAMGPDYKLLGTAGLCRLARSHRSLSLDRFLPELLNAIQDFDGDRIDDVVLLCLECRTRDRRASDSRQAAATTRA